MKYKTSKEIRSLWLNFWKKKGHKIIESKSLIPVNDPSLLWINSGVATLKKYFSGKEIPSNPKLANSQKSIRTNDIENVGVTARHHTLFEMLGNFSIGDYFKDEALMWAYELLFDVFKFEKDKIYITYFSKDKATYDKWIALGIKPSHLIKGNKSTNFWDLGQGPCGPDTEIFYDRGEKYDPGKIGLDLLAKDLENDRYIEIWNIVFSEFNNDGNNNYEELQQKNIDTGAGLERFVSIFQDAPTNFDTDLFLPIINKINTLTTFNYDSNNYFIKNKKQGKINKNFRIIADHIRAISCAIQDGATTSNVGRGYIIRRLIRRAYRAGKQLNIVSETFLELLIEPVINSLSHLTFDQNKISNILVKEQKAFAKTIKQGELLLNKAIKGQKELDANVAFKLFDTYGFPIELTLETLKENNITLNMEAFNKLFQEHTKISKGNKTVQGMEQQLKVFNDVAKKISTFIGYDNIFAKSKVLVNKKENGKYYVLLEKTPLYPTGGGQEKDKGYINDVKVNDIVKDKYGNIWHILDRPITSSIVNVIVNMEIRKEKEATHSATHLLHYALRKVLGKNIKQLGSYNDEFKLRFDFPAEKKPSKEQIDEVENIVNKLIKKKIARKYLETTYEEAVKLGAIKLENENYEDKVRVVIFDSSIEFCGGTHVKNTKDIENFKITKLESKGSGIFRIEAIVLNKHVNKFNQEQIKKLKDEVKKHMIKIQNIDKKFNVKMKVSISELEKQVEDLKVKLKKLSKQNKQIEIDYDLIEKNIIKENNIQLYINENANPATMKQEVITIRERFPNILVIFISPNANLLAAGSKSYNTQEIIKAKYPNFKGGGNNLFVMGKLI